MFLKSNNIFVGIDIEDVSKFKSIKNKKHIFTKSEIDYCEHTANKAEHYTGKWCAKEAIIKAIYMIGNIEKTYTPRDEIEVLNDDTGVPYINVKNKYLNKKYNISISISHTKKYACAIALVTRK